MPIDYGPSTPMPDDIPDDLLAAAEETDAMVGDTLAGMIPRFDKPVNVKVMDALAKAVAAAAKVMGLDFVPVKYAEPVTELEPDLVRFLAMFQAAAQDYGTPFPMDLTEIRDEAGLTALTAFLLELSKDKGFADFLDMPADEGEADVEIMIEAPMSGGGEMEEDFDFASRMR